MTQPIWNMSMDVMVCFVRCMNEKKIQKKPVFCLFVFSSFQVGVARTQRMVRVGGSPPTAQSSKSAHKTTSTGRWMPLPPTPSLGLSFYRNRGRENKRPSKIEPSQNINWISPLLPWWRQVEWKKCKKVPIEFSWWQFCKGVNTNWSLKVKWTEFVWSRLNCDRILFPQLQLAYCLHWRIPTYLSLEVVHGFFSVLKNSTDFSHTVTRLLTLKFS